MTSDVALASPAQTEIGQAPMRRRLADSMTAIGGVEPIGCRAFRVSKSKFVDG